MKSRFKLIAMVLGGLVCLQSTGAAETQPAGVDYLKLTRGNVPNARTLVDETLKNLDFNLATFKERVRKIRMSSFLPEASIWVTTTTTAHFGSLVFPGNDRMRRIMRMMVVVISGMKKHPRIDYMEIRGSIRTESGFLCPCAGIWPTCSV